MRAQLGVGVWLSQGPDESWAHVPWEWDGMRMGRDRDWYWGWDRKGIGDEMGEEPGWCKGWGRDGDRTRVR